MANSSTTLPPARHSPATIVIAVAAAIAALALTWYLFHVILLVFASILLAVVIRAPTQWLAGRTHIGERWALAIVLLLAVLILAGGGWLLGAAVKQQFQSIAEQAPQMLEQVQEKLSQYAWLDERVDPESVLDDQGTKFFNRGLQAVSVTFGALANTGLVLFMAVLLAAQPDLYKRGALHLIPMTRRTRASQVLERMGDTLRRWMLGQFVLMVFVGLCSTLGLWLLDISNPLALGLLAGLLTFVPYLGPLIAAAVAILVSLAEGVMSALWVALLYAAIQTIEGLLEPFVQQRAVYLAPVLLIVAQLTMGVLAGILGIILATPLAAVLLVAVQMLYVRDLLGDDSVSQ